MNTKLQTSTLVAGMSGVLVAFLMIAINHKPAPIKSALTYDSHKLMALKSELARVRTQLDELKTRSLTQKPLAYTPWEHPDEVKGFNTNLAAEVAESSEGKT